MQEKHEHHHWLIAILAVCVLVLSGVVAFFGYQLFYGDTAINITRVETSDTMFDETLETQRDQLEQYLIEQE